MALRVMVAVDLALPGEHVYRGEVEKVAKEIGGKKCEFALVVGGKYLVDLICEAASWRSFE